MKNIENKIPQIYRYTGPILKNTNLFERYFNYYILDNKVFVLNTNDVLNSKVYESFIKEINGETSKLYEVLYSFN